MCYVIFKWMYQWKDLLGEKQNMGKKIPQLRKLTIFSWKGINT